MSTEWLIGNCKLSDNFPIIHFECKIEMKISTEINLKKQTERIQSNDKVSIS